MSNLFLLLVVYLLYLILALFLLNGDVSAPSVLFLASFSIMLALGNIYQWYFNYDLKNETFFLMITAGLAFLLVECMYKYFLCRSHRTSLGKTGVEKSQERHNPIIVSPKIKICIIAYMLFSVFFALNVILSNTSSGTWNQRMFEFSHKSVLGVEPIKYGFIANQLQKIAKALTYVVFYILMYNKMAGKISLRKQKWSVLVLIIFVPLTLLQGHRRGLFELIVFFFMTYVLLLGTRQKKMKLLKLLEKMIPLMVIFAYAFTAIAAGVGRPDIEREAFLYVSAYLCNGLKYFDELIIGKPFSTRYFGQSSLYGFYEFLVDKLKVLPEEVKLGYRPFYGKFGNTATVFARWYEDFGFMGVIVITMITSLFFSWLHEKAFTADAPNLAQVFYAIWAPILVLASYDDRVTTLITTGNIVMIFLFWLFYRILIGEGKHRFVIGHRILMNNKDIRREH